MTVEVTFALDAISLLLVAGLEYRMKMDIMENLHGIYVTAGPFLELSRGGALQQGAIRQGGHQTLEVQAASLPVRDGAHAAVKPNPW